MKKLLIAFSLVLLSSLAFAQAPKLINYQGIARGNDGAPVLNQAIALRFRILQGSITGSVAYTETQALTTNSLGLINTQIGLKSDLGVLSWKNGPYFLEVGADLTGGNNISVFGVQQIMGVPYAFHAATVPAAYNGTTNVLDVGGNTFTLSSTPNTTLNATGIASVTNPATNSFVVSVPSPSYTAAGPFTVSGTYPNYTMAAQAATVTGTGNAVVTTTATNKFNVNVPFPQVTITSTAGATSISGSGTNTMNINIPAGVTPTINGSGVASILPATVGNNFTVNVPGTNVSGTGVAAVTSAGTNSFNVNVPGTNVSGTGVAAVTSAGTNSFNVNVPGTNVTGTGAAAVTSIGSNSFNVAVPQASVVLTATPGAAGITPIGTNSFAINLPQSNIAVTSTAGAYGVSSPGTNSFNVNVPATGIALTSTAGAQAISSTGTNSYNINVPLANVAVTSTNGLAGVSSTGTNSYNINVPTASLIPNGLVQITQAFSNFTVNVPLLTYTATTAGLGSGTNSVSILQSMTLNNTTLTSGPSSNSVNLASVTPWRQAAGSVTLATSNDKVGIGGTAPTENLQVETAASTSVSILAASTGSADLSFGTTVNHNLGRIRYDNSIGAMSFWTAGASRISINNSGQMIIGTAAPFATTTGLTVGRAGAFNNQVMISGGDASNSFGGILSFGENIAPTQGMSIKLDAVQNKLMFTTDLTGSTPVVSIGGYTGASNGLVVGTGYAAGINPPAEGMLVQGSMGIGSTSPGTKLEVIGDISIPNGNKIQFGTVSSGSGIGEWIQNSGSGLQFNTASVARMNITNTGNVGIGVASPATLLHVGGISTFDNDMNIGTSAALPADIRVYGQIRFGSETGTSQPPNYPTGSSGMTIRRVFSSNSAAGQTIATTPDLSLERDGTNGGIRINRIGTSTLLVCNCTAVTVGGGTLSKNFSNLAAGVTQVYTNAENVVFVHCMFGDPYFSGTWHITEVSLTRQNTDYFWVGSLTSTQNQ